MNKRQEEIKNKIYTEFLKAVPFDGWSNEALKHASKKAGFDSNMGEMIFTNGLLGILDRYLSEIDKEMIVNFLKVKSKDMGITKSIEETVKQRIMILNRNKLITNKIVTFMCLPWNSLESAKLSWRTVDLIWYEAGRDQSTDFNYYTKRGLLYAVYNATIMYWLSDDSKDNELTFDFLHRRLKDVVKVGSFIGKLKGNLC